MSGPILLVGAFGQGNPGDDALLASFVRALPEHRLVATISDPEAGFSERTAGVSVNEPIALLRQLRVADAIVFAGGTIFKTLRPQTGRPELDLLRKALAVTVVARMLGKPVAMVGVGAAGLPGRRARALARWLVRAADLVIVRDEESADVLAGAGALARIRVGADAAWSLFDALGTGMRAWNGSGERVVVALSHEAGDASLPDELAAALVPVLDANVPVALQPWQVGGAPAAAGRQRRPSPARDDLDLARAVGARLDGAVEVLDPPADLAHARDLLSDARVAVTMRFHALVAAGAAGVPAVALAHEPKLAGLARRLGQQVAQSPIDADRLAAAILSAERDPRPPSPAAAAAELSRAEEGMRLLRVLVSRGNVEEAATSGLLPLAARSRS